MVGVLCLESFGFVSLSLVVLDLLFLFLLCGGRGFGLTIAGFVLVIVGVGIIYFSGVLGGFCWICLFLFCFVALMWMGL